MFIKNYTLLTLFAASLLMANSTVVGISSWFQKKPASYLDSIIQSPLNAYKRSKQQSTVNLHGLALTLANEVILDAYKNPPRSKCIIQRGFGFDRQTNTVMRGFIIYPSYA